jgi:hypothetical protein
VGFTTDNLHVFSLSGKLPSRPLDNAYFATLTSEVRALPGVQAAGMTGTAPPLSYLRDTSQSIRTDDARTSQARVACAFPGFFDTLQLPLISGRDFNWGDQTMAVITSNLAEALYPGESPLGHRIQRDKLTSLEIVGVVGDVAYTGPRLGHAKVVFLPCAEQVRPWPSSYAVHIMIRSERNNAELDAGIRGVVDRLKTHYVFSEHDENEYVADALQEERTLATVSATFGSVIVLLTGVGLYAFCAYLVLLRRHELAIRTGLGAARQHIVRSLLKEFCLVFVVGSVLGIAASVGSQRVLSSLLGANLTNVASLGLGSLLMAGVALAAALGPTLRAVRIDVAAALRAD